MDNLSHSVAGLAAGELIHRSLPPEPDPIAQGLRRRFLLLTCWLASNLPDLDIVLTPLLPAPLGYLLHHRGHTHTVVYAFPQALLLAVLMWLLWPAVRVLLRESGSARKGAGLALLVGFGLHLLMDYLNSYGIHPFYPFDSRWLYGDLVFILEPVFWVAFGVTMVMTVERLALKMLLLALLLGVPLYFTTREFLSWTGFMALCAMAVVLGLLQHRADAGGKNALIAAFALGLCFVGLQGVGSTRARSIVNGALHAKDSASRVLDVSLSAFPSNPVCWAFVSVESNEVAGSYRLRRGIVSVIPDVVPVARCPASLAVGAVFLDDVKEIAFSQEAVGRLALLRGLKDRNCYFRAWMRFARAPAVENKLASDMRFASSPRGNFTTLNLEDFSDRECPKHVPGWDFPRSDLLGVPEN